MDKLFLLHLFLVIIYNAFIRPHFDYGILYLTKPYKESFHQKLESVQYNDALAITYYMEYFSRETLSETKLRISSETTLV